VFKKQNSDLSGQLRDRQLIYLILRSRQLAQHNPHQDSGYAMLIVSVLGVFMFSLMSAYLTLTNLGTSSTNAYVDGTNTFYAAESGLNTRANQLRQRFIGYTVPTGLSPGQVTTASVVTPANIANCFSMPISTSSSNTSNDFECRNYAFQYNSNSATVQQDGGTTQTIDRNQKIDYTAFTFVADKTVYDPTSTVAAPVPYVIPPGQMYSGLNSQQYLYTVYSTAAKIDPTDPVASSQRGDAKTVLQMDFKSQIIPLFQFAAFYDRDLELNSTAPMKLTGRIHTNANLYVQPTPLISTSQDIDFLGKVTVAGDIYNRVDASPTPAAQKGTARVSLGGSPPDYTPYASFPPYNASNTNPITDLSTFKNYLANQSSGVQPLSPPAPGFLRKRNYYTNQIGEYFGKADLRLEMTPNSPIPFKFTAIQNGVNARGGTCTTTSIVGQDPPQNYIDPSREGSNFKCTQFNLGQITSLQQPVLALTRGNTEEEAKFCAKPTDGSIDRTKDILNYASVTADPTTAGLSVAQIDKVLRALQVATSAARQPMDYANVAATGSLPTDVRSTFATLLADGTLNIGLTPTQITAISSAAPASIAKARRSCFLPAPIVMVATNHGYNGNNPPVQPEPIPIWVPPGGVAPPPPTQVISLILDAIGTKPANAVDYLIGNVYGLYDPREWRAMQVLQTNIESLTVWNRDGRFVSLSSANLTLPAVATDLVAALNSGDPTLAPTNPPAVDAASGNGLLFIRAQPNSGSSIGSFEHLGLAAADLTERGLVFYANVDDFLDGRTSGNSDVIADSTTEPIYKLNADNSEAKDPITGKSIILDYYRLYPNTATASRYTGKSPYAFGFNGGRNLPGSMTISSDQASYLQGDYNTVARKPAAIMADTITMLSVNCLSPGQSIDPLNIPTANLNCLIAPWSLSSGNSPWTGSPIVSPTNGKMYGAQTTSVNAAFLSFTPQSWGNLGTGRGYGSNYYSGGLNNYMRFVENWSGQNFNYSGSLVSLGTPLEFSGGFRPGGSSDSYFSPPTRNFNYDTSFNAFPSLPPMTPSVIFLQQDVFKRNH
jgi:hypothetical protein